MGFKGELIECERLYLSLKIIRIFPFFLRCLRLSWEFKGRKKFGVDRRPRFRDEF